MCASHTKQKGAIGPACRGRVEGGRSLVWVSLQVREMERLDKYHSRDSSALAQLASLQARLQDAYFEQHNTGTIPQALQGGAWATPSCACFSALQCSVGQRRTCIC